MRQYVLVQCEKCRKWYRIPLDVGIKGGVSWELIIAAMSMLSQECDGRHRGRKRASKD